MLQVTQPSYLSKQIHVQGIDETLEVFRVVANASHTCRFNFLDSSFFTEQLKHENTSMRITVKYTYMYKQKIYNGINKT